MNTLPAYDVYHQQFGDGGSFLPLTVPLHSVGGDFKHYDDLLNQAHCWYTLDKFTLRHEFEKSLSYPPISWQKKFNNLDVLQQEKLFSVVSTLSHLYRWGSMPAIEDEYQRKTIQLPLGLHTLLYGLAHKMQRPPCGSLWSTTISNYQTPLSEPGQRIDARQLSIENTSILHSWFVGYKKTQLEHWIKVFMLFEAEGAVILPVVLTLIKASHTNNPTSIIQSLTALNHSIKTLIKLFSELTHTKTLDKNIWRTTIQPTFIWGLVHQGQRLEGASGLQLGVTQILDIILGVSFKSKMGQATINSRQYMPRHHRQLLTALENDSPIFWEYMKTTDNPDIKNTYNQCIDSLKRFRRAHKQIGKIFIRGDGKEKKITTTGLSMSMESNPITEFEMDMQERINETVQKEVI